MYTDIYTVSRNKLFVFAGLITTKKRDKTNVNLRFDFK